VVFVL